MWGSGVLAGLPTRLLSALAAWVHHELDDQEAARELGISTDTLDELAAGGRDTHASAADEGPTRRGARPALGAVRHRPRPALQPRRRRGGRPAGGSRRGGAPPPTANRGPTVRTRHASTTTSSAGAPTSRPTASPPSSRWRPLPQVADHGPGEPRLHAPRGPPSRRARRAYASSWTSAPESRQSPTCIRSPSPRIRHARIVYVDNDPVVHAHAQALLASSPQGAWPSCEADATRPGGDLRVPGGPRHPGPGPARRALPRRPAALRDGRPGRARDPRALTTHWHPAAT